MAINKSSRRHITRRKEDAIHPNYYQRAGSASPIDLIKAYELDFPLGCVVKYVARHKEKNGREDLKKALFYLLWSLGQTKEQIKAIVDAIE